MESAWLLPLGTTDTVSMRMLSQALPFSLYDPNSSKEQSNCRQSPYSCGDRQFKLWNVITSSNLLTVLSRIQWMLVQSSSAKDIIMYTRGGTLQYSWLLSLPQCIPGHPPHHSHQVHRALPHQEKPPLHGWHPVVPLPFKGRERRWRGELYR